MRLPKSGISQDGAFWYHGDVKGHNNGNLTIKDHTTGAVMTCKAGALSANVPVSKVASGGLPPLAFISGVSFRSCAIGGIPATVAKKPMTPKVALHAGTYAAPKTKGFLGTLSIGTALSLGITGKGNSCAATINGSTLPISYSNTNHALILDAAQTTTLTIKGAAHCGLFHTNDIAYISGKYTITSPSMLTVSLR